MHSEFEGSGTVTFKLLAAREAAGMGYTSESVRSWNGDNPIIRFRFVFKKVRFIDAIFFIAPSLLNLVNDAYQVVSFLFYSMCTFHIFVIGFDEGITN